MYYKEQLESIRQSLMDLLKDLTRESSGLPDGSLHIYEKKGNVYYCQRLPKEGNRKKEHRVSINNDPDLVLALARKKYIETALGNVKRNVELLDKAISSYKPVGEESVLKRLYDKYPAAADVILSGRRESTEWAESFEHQDDFYTDGLKSTSSKGEKMRSGGEMYIASRLEHFGIPYRYESPLRMPDHDYSPDFTIMRPRDRKILYWEHFGMVNDINYIRNNLGKVGDYIDYGIKPWDNLIMTFNNEKGGYNGKMIDAMIECWLL